MSQQIATALGLRHRSRVVLARVSTRRIEEEVSLTMRLLKVNEQDFLASHVEITFRDAYLTRADMWRLVVSELANQSIYKGQRLIFMGTIKAQIRTIYMNGHKVQSAFFGPSTKPIFRSESARYVLFIQMSKEMWDFDTDGTGEILFHKVINGFLPELFRRWESISARHLVSIILFTRLEYQNHMAPSFGKGTQENKDEELYSNAVETSYRDFYRVLVSDMSLGQWSAILIQLKKEFKVFLRDVSIRTASSAEKSTLGQDSVPKGAHDIIAGRPTAAMQGNILEAINLASSQFSGDYIDRDLVRTGLSIVVISPGTGVFEVDRTMLAMTTDTLIDNSVGIDLVCLSPMPLHSVPLFKYATHEEAKPNKNIVAESSAVRSSEDPLCISNSAPTSHLSLNRDWVQHNSWCKDGKTLPQWHYVIPHWIDISFWTSSPTHKRSVPEAGDSSQQNNMDIFDQKLFVPRVKMYEVQMMGIMENEMGNISIPYLRAISKTPQATTSKTSKPETDYRSPFTPYATSAKGQDLKPNLTRSDTASISSSTDRDSYRKTTAKDHASLIQWIDDYDARVFSHPYEYRDAAGYWQKQSTQSINTGRALTKKPEPIRSSPLPKGSPQMYADDAQIEQRTRLKVPVYGQDAYAKKEAESSSISNKSHKHSNLSRQVSFGLRGFGGAAPKAIPITEISSANAQSGSLLAHGLRQQRLHPMLSTVTDSDSDDNSLGSSASMNPSLNFAQVQASEFEDKTKPITIKPQRDPQMELRLIDVQKKKYGKESWARNEHTSADESEKAHLPHRTGVSPLSAMAPWLTVLNPSNPRSTVANPASRLGRWHHVFPRPMRTSNIKWKSLCSPASVPLTTEDFPTEEQLSIEYSVTEYEVSAFRDNELSEEKATDEWLIRELISARFSHGFQVVIGSQLRAAVRHDLVVDTSLFMNTDLGSKGNVFFMSKGSIIHKLSVINEGIVHIKEYSRQPKTVSSLNIQDYEPIPYVPVVRVTLSDHYAIHRFVISASREQYDWKRLDTFIAGHEEQQPKRYPDPLQFWRARFVLIPKERPVANKKLPYSLNEDNEEEIRLEGIRKLTQIWQKSRYFPPEERRFQTTLRRRKDLNPLDIIYQTRIPSTIVAAELNGSLLSESDGTDIKPAQLLPESELFERANVNIGSIASAIQGDHGVTMMDRRWHWRLHYNCFIGMELTTWILNTFRDIESREEAVELGNELMAEGLFQHVERRHNFRDGNFFYQISSEYRIPRPDSRTSWFGSRRSDRSVPSTPVTEAMKSSPVGMRSRSSSISEGNHDGESSTPTRKQTLGVALSKRLIYDIDPRKRSYRRELITLHYDRIASADDCYHLRIDWMSATPKLIEDAIVQWATLAERNGLRLVELPIGEASKINDLHPFRSPYTIKLVKSPPEQQPQTYFDAVSLSPKAAPSWSYHKAILKKFNFVLDLEAAKDFPQSVDVTYSWGKPDYQYAQYISRDGIVLAQITDEGDFLLLANRLYTNRSAATKENGRLPPNSSDEANSAFQRSPARPVDSPSASPAIRATPDVGCGFTSPEMVTPETVAYELEAFCTDIKALEAFYEEVLQTQAVSGSATPLMESTTSGLTAPPAFSLRDLSPAARLENIGERRKSRMDKAARDVG